MADFKLADINIGQNFVRTDGKLTGYSQRWLQDNNRRIGAAISDLVEVQAELADAQADIVAQQAQINALILDLSDQVSNLATVQHALQGSGATAAATTDGSGIASFTHGYSFPPGVVPDLQYCVAFPYTDAIALQMVSVNATTLRVRCFDSTGALIISSGVGIVFRVGSSGSY